MVTDQEKLQRQSSMDYWWPKLESVDVFTPETVRLEIVDAKEYQGGLSLPVPDIDVMLSAIESVGGPPAFFRSDVTSRKHEMNRGSRIVDAEKPLSHVGGIVEQHHMAMGMPMPSSYYVREWLNLYHEYKSFADSATPIAAEVRFFLLDGELHDYGFYWPEESIWEHAATKDNWRELHERVKETALNGVRVGNLKKYARRVANTFDEGYWSVDFALTDRDQWYAIDMARGELSWHPNSVEHAVEDPRE